MAPPQAWSLLVIPTVMMDMEQITLCMPLLALLRSALSRTSEGGTYTRAVVQFIAAVNVQAASGYFPMAPYAQGRFSNGPIYLEIAAASLSNVLNSYATGAAVTGAPGSASVLPVYPPYAGLTSVKTVPVPSGLQQVLCPGCER